MRKGAVDAIQLLGQPSELVIAILRECKKHKDPYVANKASSILKYWGLESAIEGNAEKTAKSAGTEGGNP